MLSRYDVLKSLPQILGHEVEIGAISSQEKIAPNIYHKTPYFERFQCKSDVYDNFDRYYVVGQKDGKISFKKLKEKTTIFESGVLKLFENIFETVVDQISAPGLSFTPCFLVREKYEDVDDELFSPTNDLYIFELE